MSEPEEVGRVAALKERYVAALHAMQSGVAAKLGAAADRGRDMEDCSPKHLRVGVNAAMVDHGALVSVLLKRKLITEAEYWESVVETMEREVELYKAALKRKLGVDVDLA